MPKVDVDRGHLLLLETAVGQSGTSSEGGGSSVGLMITVALFLHKAPEAAGYGTYIVHMNCTRAQKITYLIVSPPPPLVIEV